MTARYHRPQKIEAIVQRSSGLVKLKAQAGTLAQLETVMHTILPEPLNQNCRIANFRNHILVVQVSSASWLVRLKYQHSDLMLALRQKAIPSLSSIEYQIAPDFAELKQINPRRVEQNNVASRTLTKESAKWLFELAQRSPESLKNKLIKLTKHAK